MISRQSLSDANSVDNDNKREDVCVCVCVCVGGGVWDQERPCLKWLEGRGHYELLSAFCICCNEYWGGYLEYFEELTAFLIL